MQPTIDDLIASLETLIAGIEEGEDAATVLNYFDVQVAPLMKLLVKE